MQTASLTLGMKNALSALGDLQGQIEGTNKRLATGKKVNSALDNALNFFVADSFTSKARGLQTILDNIGLGLNVLKQTDKALTSIRTSLDQAEGTLRAALNTSGTNSKVISTFNFRDAQTGAANPNANFFAATTDTARNRFQSGDSFVLNLATYDANGVVVSTLGTVTVANAGSTVQQVIDAINTTAGAGAFNVAGQSPRVTAYLNDAGNLVIENNVSGNDPLAPNNTFGLRFNATNVNGPTQNTLEAFTFTGAVGANPINTTIGANQQIVSIVGATTAQSTRVSAASSFREVLNQIRNSALDAGFNGTNLLQGDFLRTIFNEDETTSIVTQGQRLDASALGFTADLGVGTAAASGDAARNFQSDSELSAALKKVRNAKTQINSISAQFASNANLLSNRQDYTKFQVKNFNDGADLLTLADINEEGANLSSLQTRQQLAVTALSLANQSDQAILRLF